LWISEHLNKCSSVVIFILMQTTRKQGIETYNPKVLQAPEVFYLLSDPTRLKIIQTLSKTKEMCVSEIQSETDVTLSAVSHQLSMLEARCIVEKCRYGRTICYCINKKNPIAKKILRILKII